MKQEDKDAQCRQYRDWLIPATIFVGVGASLLILALAEHQFTWLLITSAGTSLFSIAAFLLSLLWAFTRIEELESLGVEKEEDGTMFLLTIVGILSLLASIVLFCFWRDLRLGLCSLGLLFLFFFLFWFFLRHTTLFGKKPNKTDAGDA